jgi:two-component system OmpR family sensor kinase
LSEDLLLLARMDDSQPFLRPVVVSLPELLRTAAGRARAHAAAREITVTVDAPDGITVFADPDRLRQAVDNLLDNATRHAPPGSEVQVTAGWDDEGSVTIAVGDRGPGFPEEFLPHAFERFHRAEAARSRDGGGAGLGLSIVQAVARAHGGRSTADNRKGGGASVAIRIPRDRP